MFILKYPDLRAILTRYFSHILIIKFNFQILPNILHYYYSSLHGVVGVTISLWSLLSM